MTLKRKLKRLKDKLTPSIYINTKYGMKNLIRWFPIIWNDRDYDYIFIFNILKFKLENMEERFRICDYTMSSQRNAEEIRRCLKVLDRLTNQEYYEIAFKFLDKKYGDIKMEYGEEYKDGSVQVFPYREYETKDNKEKVKKDTLRCMYNEDYLESQDIEYLFRSMRRHMRKWWD